MISITMGLERSGIIRSSSSPTSCRSKYILCVFFLCLLLCAVTSTIVAPSSPSPHTRSSYSEKLATFYAEGEGKRRRARGMGSWPPRCEGKCGRCSPCKPVHVAVPPFTSEYYPEAWRCQCRHRLYIP